MKLNDARRWAIKQQVVVRFPLSSGGECVIDRHGLARIPGLKGPTEVSAEQEFAAAQQFTLEAAEGLRSVGRAEFEHLAAAGGEVLHAAADHDE